MGLARPKPGHFDPSPESTLDVPNRSPNANQALPLPRRRKTISPAPIASSVSNSKTARIVIAVDEPFVDRCGMRSVVVWNTNEDLTKRIAVGFSVSSEE